MSDLRGVGAVNVARLVQPVRCVVCGRLGTAIVTPRGLVAPPGWWRRWGRDLSFVCSAACAKDKEA